MQDTNFNTWDAGIACAAFVGFLEAEARFAARRGNVDTAARIYNFIIETLDKYPYSLAAVNWIEDYRTMLINLLQNETARTKTNP
jgi:hypothetical protein